MQRTLLTLTLAVQDGRILLGMKKRGFGAGRWNGFGGKMKEGETIEAAALRETAEECGIEVTKLERAGIHEFRFVAKPDEMLEVHLFRILEFTGTPVETEEMRPQWFAFADIPYDTMWPDDRYWMPFFLDNKKFRTSFLFGPGDSIVEQSVTPVTAL